MTETAIKIDHARRAVLHSHAVDLLRINKMEVTIEEPDPLILVAERLGFLSIDPLERASLGLPEKPSTGV